MVLSSVILLFRKSVDFREWYGVYRMGQITKNSICVRISPAIRMQINILQSLIIPPPGSSITVSDKAQVKPLQFGFSDSVKVYFNGQLIYGGNDLFRSRDYRFLGTIGYYDTLYLPLLNGKNELIMAVSEKFGGWGVQARFADMTGISLRKF